MDGRLTPAQSGRLRYKALALLVGVGMLAFAGQAQAKVIFTPVDVKIGIGGVDSYPLDLNGDGTTDYTIQQIVYTAPCDLQGDIATFWAMEEVAGVQNRAVVTLPSGSSAAALPAGALIDSSRPFAFGVETMAVYYSGPNCEDEGGNWDNVTDLFLGLKFQIQGKTHYGWARLSVQHVPSSGFTATLTGWAYQTIANRGLTTGISH